MKILMDRPITLFKAVLSLVLISCTSLFMIRTLHWSLVNDPALMHYISFLIDHGMAPYRDIADMNLPGCYMIDWAVIHTLGGGALAWRVFDYALLGVAAIAMIAIALPYDWFAGVFGAALFSLFHGRDGIGQSGQRDLIMAVLLLVGYAFLFYGTRKTKSWMTGLFGLFMGMAITIKPTIVLLPILLLLMAAAAQRKRNRPFISHIVAAIVGFMVPIAAVFIFLVRERALSAFLAVAQGLLVYHASVGRRGALYMLTWCMTTSVMALLLIAVVITIAKRDWKEWEKAALLVGVGFGLISYLAQGKGYPYHRYPMLAFLFLWMGIEFSVALKEKGVVRALGMAGFVYGTLALAPLYLIRASHAQWNEDLLFSLESDLNHLGGGSFRTISSVLTLLVGAQIRSTVWASCRPQETFMTNSFLAPSRIRR